MRRRLTVAVDILKMKPVGHLSDDAPLGLHAAVWREYESSYSREELKLLILQPLRTIQGAERMRGRALAVMHWLCWRDLTVAKDVMSHLHRDNKQELNEKRNQDITCHLIHSCLHRAV